MFREQDEIFMRRAIEVARGNPARPFGTILVRRHARGRGPGSESL